MNRSGKVSQMVFKDAGKKGVHVSGRLDDGDKAAGVLGTPFAGYAKSAPVIGSEISMEGELVVKDAKATFQFTKLTNVTTGKVLT